MIQVMANENMDEWKVSPSVIDETVKVAKQFLEQHPEEVNVSGETINHRLIAKFLGWNETRVYNSLERLKLIDQNELDKEVIKVMPTERHAREFSLLISKLGMLFAVYMLIIKNILVILFCIFHHSHFQVTSILFENE